MADLESCLRIKQRLVIKFLEAEQCKPGEIFRRMSDVCVKKHAPVKKCQQMG